MCDLRDMQAKDTANMMPMQNDILCLNLVFLHLFEFVGHKLAALKHERLDQSLDQCNRPLWRPERLRKGSVRPQQERGSTIDGLSGTLYNSGGLPSARLQPLETQAQ